MKHPLYEILGDFETFFEMQSQRLRDLDIDIEGCDISHLAFRTTTLEEYLSVREKIEMFCSANVENIWGGRPISKMLLKTPLNLAAKFATSLIELIPPEHPDPYQDVYKMGLEHVGIVIGETFDEFGEIHARKFTGQQDQGPFCQPYFITFPDLSNVKFYRFSLQDVCIKEGKRFDRFYHVMR